MNIKLLAERAKEFNTNIKLYQAMAVQDSEKTLVDMNRKQLLSSKNSKGQTIKPPYTKKYAEFKGFKNPNLKLSGDFQKDMFLETNENAGTYFISSFDFKTPFLEARYDFIFGVKDQKKASIEPSKQLLMIYANTVWKNS